MSNFWKQIVNGSDMSSPISSTVLEGDCLDERKQMVEEQIIDRGISNPLVIRAMLSVRRHEFLPKSQGHAAYADRPVPIGEGQTMSQPYIVAQMVELAQLKPGDKVLEIGTGSGYQAAILAHMGVQTFSIEIVEGLAQRAEECLRQAGYSASLRVGDGSVGWPEEAPFNAIIVAAAAPVLPAALAEQLTIGGKLVLPIGSDRQDLYVITRKPVGYEQVRLESVIFVPMIGQVQTAAGRSSSV